MAMITITSRLVTLLLLIFEEDEALLNQASETYSSAADTPLLHTEETPQLMGASSSENPF